jgi:urea carboxylase-associated protein 2
LSETILWEEDLRGGQTWSHVLQPSMAIRLTDIEGGANVCALFYNADQPEERYNMPDTLKAQHIARLTKGFVLYSDMGRILCSITDDTVGWHDPIGGTLARAQLASQYGERPYQEYRNDWTQAPKESLLLELAKYSLGPRDWPSTLNLFSKVQVDETGAMRYVPGNSKAGDSVELRAEMKVLVLLSANHHAMETGSVYAPKPVRLTIKQVAPAAEDDPCRVSRPENGRGFALTARCCR